MEDTPTTTVTVHGDHPELQTAMESIQVNLEHRLPPATYLVKEEVLSKVMEFRTVTRQILSRAQGEAAEAVNIDHQRHLLIRQGDGRYLSMSAITNDQVKEALGNLAPMTKRLLGCEELRDQVATLLAAEILGKDYVKYMKHEEEVEAMTFEDKVSGIFCTSIP